MKKTNDIRPFLASEAREYIVELAKYLNQYWGSTTTAIYGILKEKLNMYYSFIPRSITKKIFPSLADRVVAGKGKKNKDFYPPGFFF